MIDEEETFKRFGYYSTDLSHASRKKIVAICDGCEKIRIQEKHHYNSMCPSCCKTGRKGEKSNGYHGGKTGMRCDTCGMFFFRYEKLIKKEQIKVFCSRECSSKSRNGSIVRKCKMCGKSFSVFNCYIKDGRGLFCSPECGDKWRTGENHPNWNNGSSFGKYCSKFNEKLKEKIRKKYDRKCFLCGKNECENKQKLSVHHVNYDKQCMCSDIPCQMVPLCTKCHSATNSNREFWYKLIMDKLAQRIDGYCI